MGLCWVVTKHQAQEHSHSCPLQECVLDMCYSYEL